MSLNDLRTLHEEPAKFDDFVSKHSHQRTVDDIVARLRAEVDQLEQQHRLAITQAEINIDENKIDELRRQVNTLQAEVDELQNVYDDWHRKNSSQRLIERLRVAIRESENLSESLEKNMLSSGMNFDDFQPQYLESREKYHERSLKLEQLKLESKRNVTFDR